MATTKPGHRAREGMRGKILRIDGIRTPTSAKRSSSKLY